jgi:hypothetical protein
MIQRRGAAHRYRVIDAAHAVEQRQQTGWGFDLDVSAAGTKDWEKAKKLNRITESAQAADNESSKSGGHGSWEPRLREIAFAPGVLELTQQHTAEPTMMQVEWRWLAQFQRPIETGESLSALPLFEEPLAQPRVFRAQ